jgi:hypothetical protein
LSSSSASVCAKPVPRFEFESGRFVLSRFARVKFRNWGRDEFHFLPRLVKL